MEDFSQSRGDDDLFDDEIIPFQRSEQEDLATQVQQISLQSAAPATAPNRGPEIPRGPRGRGRGGAPRGPGKKNDLAGSKWASEPIPDSAPKGATELSQKPSNPPTEDSQAPVTEDLAIAAPQPPPPTPQTPSRPAAVRGDRTGTGGIKKPKLTEDELTAKLLAAKERSQTLSAAHARAQADAASFEERERIAQEKRAKEKVERRAMDSERHKNAARKAAAMGGREWDLEKNEDDFRIQRGGERRGRGSGTMRAMNGAVVDRGDPGFDDLSQYQWHEGRGRGRGRGERGRGRGGRAGRGDARGDIKQPNVKAETEFPSLPMSTPAKDNKQATRPAAAARVASEALSPTGEISSWADQVGDEVAKA